jgi:radical SAM superfamily enzyme YgiQ (UPF0313 family)
MKITFIVPAIGKKPGQKYIGTWKMEPLTIAVLNSLTPEDVERELFDDRIELINYDTRTDLAVITVETYTARRSYQIAKEFRDRGVRVVMGGYHVTLNPEEASRHSNCIVTGNAEEVWGNLIDDARAGRLKNWYKGGVGFNQNLPDRRIFDGKKYLPISLVETGRGCGHACEFCAISGYYQCRYYPRDDEQVLADLRTSKHKYHFFVDDNLTADGENAKRLFDRITPAKIKWAGQGTLAMARDEELLRRMKKSGCELILIGFESLEQESLRQMNKSWVETVGERDELVERIHAAGINIYATFVFGYDGDTQKTFEDTLAFAKKHNFYTAAFNHLLPFPGTPLYERLKRQGRLLYDNWWLEDGYRYGELAFKPKNMTPGQVSAVCRQNRKDFSGLPVVLGRGRAHMKRSNPAMWPLFWAMNLRLGGEIDEKMNVPVGRNLDELPK